MPSNYSISVNRISEKLVKYFKHSQYIAKGIYGEISKIDEEVEELKDAAQQEKLIFEIIECADIIHATGRYARKKFWCPLIVLILLCYLRKPYKLIRRLILGPKK